MADELRAVVSEIRSIDPSDDDWADLESLEAALAGVRVVLLGEQSHCDGSTFLAKARLIGFLCERLGFDLIAFESPMYWSKRAASAIAAGWSAPDVLRVALWEVWHVSEVVPTFERVVSSQATERPIEICGFDPLVDSSTAPSLIAEACELLSGEVPSNAAGVARALRGEPVEAPLISALAADAERIRRGLVSADRESVYRQWLARCVRGLELSLRMAASRELLRTEWASDDAVALSDERDRLMAENLRWIVEASAGRKTVVWAATGHVLRNVRSLRRGALSKSGFANTVTMGDLLAQWFGSACYAIGFTAFEGAAGSPHTDEVIHVGGALPGSVEFDLAGLGFGAAFVDLRNLPVGHPLRGERSARPVLYEPMVAGWPRLLDGLIYIRTTEPATEFGAAPSGHVSPSAAQRGAAPDHPAP